MLAAECLLAAFGRELESESEAYEYERQRAMVGALWAVDGIKALRRLAGG